MVNDASWPLVKQSLIERAVAVRGSHFTQEHARRDLMTVVRGALPEKERRDISDVLDAIADSAIRTGNDDLVPRLEGMGFNINSFGCVSIERGKKRELDR